MEVRELYGVENHIEEEFVPRKKEKIKFEKVYPSLPATKKERDKLREKLLEEALKKIGV